jgi:hypothetical protein
MHGIAGLFSPPGDGQRLANRKEEEFINAKWIVVD